MSPPAILNPIDSGVNSVQTSRVISYPAYNNGDLILIGTANDDNANVLLVTAPAGPNAEVITKVVDQHTGGQADQRISVFWYIATAGAAAATFTFTSDVAEQWIATVARVAANDFDAITPVGASALGGNSAASSTSQMSAITAGASDGDGTLLCYGAMDNVRLSTTPLAGWTYLSNQDIGAVGGYLAQRTAAVVDDEAIAVANFDLFGANSETSATYGFIIRPFVAAAATAMAARMQQEGYNG